MKKKLLFAFVGAIALSGAVGITSCSSSDDVADVNPFFDSETNSVKTGTRSGATTVQAGGENFRGIDNTLLFAFKTSGKGFIDATSAAAAAANRYDLGTVAAAGSLDNDGSNSHRILELAMPNRYRCYAVLRQGYQI